MLLTYLTCVDTIKAKVFCCRRNFYYYLIVANERKRYEQKKGKNCKSRVKQTAHNHTKSLHIHTHTSEFQTESIKQTVNCSENDARASH